jgi:glucuronoarabinoxylan endo-1,4-beta-xylanase
MKRYQQVLVLAVTIVLFLGVVPTSFAANATVTVDYRTRKQTVSGFGASITWTANDLSRFSAADQATILNLLYSTSSPSAGISIIRAGSMLCEFNPSPGIYDWNHALIQSEINWMSRVKSTYGINQFMVTTWTPPAYTKDNNSCSGGSVLPARYPDLANTMVLWMQNARTALGQEVNAWSVQNEPATSTSYDSALYTPQQFIDFVNGYLKPAMVNAGLTSKIVLPEPSVYGGASYFDSSWATPLLSNAQMNANLDILATHGYGATSNLADPSQAALLYNKPIWETEISNLNSRYSGSISEALGWADSIYGALNSGNFSAWFWWWSLNYNNSNEGLIQYNNSTFTYQVPKRLYVIGNFARFIRPGAVVLASTSSSANVKVTAVQPVSGTVTVVLTNPSKQAITATVSFSGAASLPVSVTPYRTSSTENQVPLTSLPVNGGSVTITLPAQSVVTLVG